MNAIISPTCMLPRSIALPPNQTMSRLVPFMMSVINGIMATIVRLVNSWVFIRSVLALSKRFSSNSSRLNARMGIMPVRISRLTRFSRSTKTCICLNFGMATFIKTAMSASSAATATKMIHSSPVLPLATCIMPPMPKMGA